MPLGKPSAEDVRKINAEINQLVNQRFFGIYSVLILGVIYFILVLGMGSRKFFDQEKKLKEVWQNIDRYY